MSVATLQRAVHRHHPRGVGDNGNGCDEVQHLSPDSSAVLALVAIDRNHHMDW